MRARIIRIGNSRGLRIPKALLEEAGLQDEVEITIRGDALVVRSARTARSGWEDAFREMASHGDDRLLDADLIADGTVGVDESAGEEWEWK
jgi:antitoxin MazE